MKKILKNIFVIVISMFVVVLSMGVSISKMGCDTNGNIFLGKNVPNCMKQEVLACTGDLKEISCCKKDKVLESCCPTTKDDTCESDTKDFQFDFETIIPVSDFSFINIDIPLLYLFLHNIDYSSLKENFYQSQVPLPRLQKPYLEKIQSFLL